MNKLHISLSKRMIIWIVTASVAVLLLLFVVYLCTFGVPAKYSFASNNCENNPYAARDAIANVNDSYKDTANLKQYIDALICYKEKDYSAAEKAMVELDYYRNCRIYISEIRYKYAQALKSNGDYLEAAAMFEKSGYDDYLEQISKSRYLYADRLYDTGEYILTAEAFAALGNYRDSLTRCLESRIADLMEDVESGGDYAKAVELADAIAAEDTTGAFSTAVADIHHAYAITLIDANDYEAALTQLNLAAGCSDKSSAAELKKYCEDILTYKEAVDLMSEKKYAEAVALFDLIPGFLDADELNAKAENKAYDWTFKGFVSKDGKKKTSTFLRTDTIYCYGTLTGGKPGRIVDLRFVWTDVAGCTVSSVVSGFMDGTSGGVTFKYSIPKNANFGKSTITVTIDGTNEQVAKFSFTIQK